MANVHTADEQIAVGDVEGMARVTLALLEAARDQGGRWLSTSTS